MAPLSWADLARLKSPELLKPSAAMQYFRKAITMPSLPSYEKRHQKLASQAVFIRRLASNVILAGAILAASLAAGMAGYGYFEGLPAIDAFLNASMILSGMGPVATMQTAGGKLFAGFYALYSGVVLIASVSVILAPIMHRLLHTFHCAGENDEKV